MFRYWILPLLLKRPILIFSIILIPMTLVIGQVSLPWFTRSLLNALYQQGNLQLHATYLALTWGFSKLMIRGLIFINASSIAHLIQDIRTLIYEKILSLNHKERIQRTPSNWTQLTLDLAKSVEYTYSTMIWYVLPTLGLFILILFEVYKIHYLFFLIYVIYIFLQFSIMCYAKKYIGHKSQSHNQEKNKLIDNYDPLFNPNLFFQHQKQLNELIKRFDLLSSKETSRRNELIKSMNKVRLVMDLLAVSVFILVLFLVVKEKHMLLIGDLSFILMTLISTIDKAWSLGQNWCDLQRAFSLISHHQWLVNITFRSENTLILNDKKPLNISIQNLSFRYKDNKPLFQNFNLNIPNQSIIGLSGVPGSGKSTLFKLIFGIHSPYTGHINIDGINISQIEPNMRGSFITFLPQEPNLITNLSIFDNLKIFFPDVSLSDIKRSMVLAGCASWLSECESILDLQLVSELSRGQQQQLCIVRAFLDPKPIWLLDEALSAVDIHTHQKIMFNITHHPMIKKIILISHQKRDHYLCQAMMSINHQSNETYSSLSICQ